MYVARNGCEKDNFMNNNSPHPDWKDEIHERCSMIVGKWDTHDAIELMDAMHLVENNPGKSTSALERESKRCGCGSRGMKWKLMCLEILGFIKFSTQGSGYKNWYKIYK